MLEVQRAFTTKAQRVFKDRNNIGCMACHQANATPTLCIVLNIKSGSLTPLRIHPFPPTDPSRRSSGNTPQLARRDHKISPQPNLHAQERMLPILLMAEGVVSVGKQRVDMYYRNDPSEYSLNQYHLKPAFYIATRHNRLWVLV